MRTAERDYTDDDAQEDGTMDMGVLRDCIAYAKANLQPTLMDSASQRLISAYLMDMRKVGSGRGRITAYPLSWIALFGWRRFTLRRGSQLLWSSRMWRRSGVCTARPSSRRPSTRPQAVSTSPF